MHLNVVNVVANFSVGKHLELKNLARLLWNVEYNPKKFGALILRQRDPYCTFLIFNNGKFVCCGCKSIVDCFLTCKKLVRKLRKLLKVRLIMKEWKTQNVVACFKINHKLNLIQIKQDWQNGSFILNNVESCHYEPELFSALQFKLKGHSVLIFNTGKIILTGFVCPQKLNETYIYLKSIL